MLSLIQLLNRFVWNGPMLLLLGITHIFFTYRLRFVQRQVGTGIKWSMTPEPGQKEGFSSFSALSTTLAATLVGWSYFGKSAMEYLYPKGSGTGYIVVYLVMIFVGGIASLDFVWETADLLNAFMVIPNLIALFVLQRYLPRKY